MYPRKCAVTKSTPPFVPLHAPFSLGRAVALATTLLFKLTKTTKNRVMTPMAVVVMAVLAKAAAVAAVAASCVTSGSSRLRSPSCFTEAERNGSRFRWWVGCGGQSGDPARFQKAPCTEPRPSPQHHQHHRHRRLGLRRPHRRLNILHLGTTNQRQRLMTTTATIMVVATG